MTVQEEVEKLEIKLGHLEDERDRLEAELDQLIELERPIADRLKEVQSKIVHTVMDMDDLDPDGDYPHTTFGRTSDPDLMLLKSSGDYETAKQHRGKREIEIVQKPRTQPEESQGPIKVVYKDRP